ncbi:hypothetical protein VT99_10522 [Candidatus Electrothrix marina]|uniref:Uncharacterized protein n=1 Tax=Candidatus Electrothrix marina TaxID=1859130 RepID=A0A3S4TGN0_9BACT|nr:hypothetical protein VT99_10522 [Candidatus Electrothrix marina]RWX50114.1 hypothetical protein VU00_11421 [Candidatus Electrothrix marina]
MQENESRQQERLFALHQDEYSSLKAEQASRIGFRDNLLYVTLGVVGGVCAYAVKKPEHASALLLIPWACFIYACCSPLASSYDSWIYVPAEEKSA